MARGLFCLLSFIICSCSILDPPLPTGRPRLAVTQDPFFPPSAPIDTSILVSAVDYPPGYDWRKDSLYGEVACRLLLFRGSSIVLDIPAGKGSRVSPAPDGHHLVDGHLFTDYSDEEGTTVGMDGTPLFTIPEREILCGILQSGGSIFTLGRNRSGSGFSLRQDGSVLLKKESGTPFGNFGTPGYGPGGGLYIDDGHIRFAYRDGEKVYFVSDGKESLGSASCFRVVDAKFLDGQPCILFNENDCRSTLACSTWTLDIGNGLDVFWLEAGIVLYDGEPAAAGSFHLNGEGLTDSGVLTSRNYYDAGFDAFLQIDGGDIFGAGTGPDGTLITLDLRKPGSISWEMVLYYFPRPECFRHSGGKAILALTPLSPGERPFLRVGEKEISYDINGYLTGIL